MKVDTIRQIILRSPKYRALRLKILEEARYICVICGKSKIHMHAHHKKPLRVLIGEFLIQYPQCIREDIFNYAPFWDRENLEARCVGCHLGYDYVEENHIHYLTRKMYKIIYRKQRKSRLQRAIEELKAKDKIQVDNTVVL